MMTMMVMIVMWLQIGIVKKDNLKIIRPANGLAPKHWDEVIGKKSKIDLKAGTPLIVGYW